MKRLKKNNQSYLGNNINKVSYLSIIFLIPLFLTACATTSDLEQLRSELRNTQITLLHQQRDVAEIKAKVAELSKDIYIIKETAVKEPAFGAIKESQQSILDQISRLQMEIQSLRSRVEEDALKSDREYKEILSERELHGAKISAIERELQDIKKKIGLDSEEKKEVTSDQKPVKEPSSVTPLTKPELIDPQKIFDVAQADFKEKRYVEARLGYERIVKDFPKHPSAPLAQFAIAETYYSEKKYEDAILAYETFIKKYPTHEKVRMAMLKQGYSFFELGDKKTGKIILERLIEKYPRSQETEMAKKKLSEVLPKKKR
ncbi:MAG: tol-pal system protein YbgF [Thermodesulfovibrionales bacterium]|nr:tol-pal system protein YbgF [Thermodesulfovibrionales bacterium]